MEDEKVNSELLSEDSEGISETEEEIFDPQYKEVAPDKAFGETEAKEIPTIKLGLKEVTEIVDFGIAIGMGMAKSLADGKITLEDVPNFMSSFTKLIPAMTGWKEARLELLAAGPGEVENLKDHIRETLDLENEELEGLIEASLALVLDTWHLVNTFFIKEEK